MEAQYTRMRQMPTRRVFDIRSDVGGVQGQTCHRVIAGSRELDAEWRLTL